jgi:putative transposase
MKSAESSVPLRETCGFGHYFYISMARNARCILRGLAYHVTQRGTNRQKVFFSSAHRKTYLKLLERNLDDAGARVLAYCLMPNHVHLVVIPERADSLAILFRRVHGAYAQAVNAGLGRSGHLWQNRFYSCPLSERHLWVALRYVEANPVRAGLAARPEHYPWSSAPEHLSERKPSGLVDAGFWERAGGVEMWRQMHASAEGDRQLTLLRRCTYAGRPFGEEEFIIRLEDRFQRKWRRWSFEKSAAAG